MSYLLNIVYAGLLLVLSPWLACAAVFRGKYREGYAANLLGRIPPRCGNRPCLWFHAVSVGEVNLLKPLLERIQDEFPEWECVVSTTTKTGFDLARAKYANHFVFYCPLDFSWAVKTAIRRIRPDALVLAELELWPNLIRGAKQAGAAVAIINGRLSDQSERGYRRARWLIGPLLRQLDLVAVQNDEYAARFLRLGARSSSVAVTGSLKFDGAETDRGNPKTRELARRAGFHPDDVVFLAGSTQHPEESFAIEAFKQWRSAFPNLKLVLAPRHPDRCGEIVELLEKSGQSWRRRSALNEPAASSATSILLIDTIGELAAWWGTARIAYVGGSMGRRGGQNMIEPAAYGAAVAFGPKTRNFRDVVRLLLHSDAAIVVHDNDELTAFVGRCLQDPPWATHLGVRAKELVAQQLGATDRTLGLIAGLLGQQPSSTVVTGVRDETLPHSIPVWRRSPAREVRGS